MAGSLVVIFSLSELLYCFSTLFLFNLRTWCLEHVPCLQETCAVQVYTMICVVLPKLMLSAVAYELRCAVALIVLKCSLVAQFMHACVLTLLLFHNSIYLRHCTNRPYSNHWCNHHNNFFMRQHFPCLSVKCRYIASYNDFHGLVMFSIILPIRLFP